MHGFSLGEIKEMTLPQFNMFIKACGRLEKRVMWRDVMAVLAGSRYDEQGLNKLERQLEK